MARDTIIHDSYIEAFVAAQAEFPDIPKSAKANYGHYAPLDKVVALIRPILNKHGIGVIQKPYSGKEGKLYLKTVLKHVSGESDSTSVELLLTKQDAQGLGSAMTYIRRYSLLAMLGLAPDDDDDGQAASAPVKARTPKPATEGPSEAQEKKINILVHELWPGDEGKDYRDKTRAQATTKALASQLIEVLEARKADRVKGQPSATETTSHEVSPTLNDVVDLVVKANLDAHKKAELSRQITGQPLWNPKKLDATQLQAAHKLLLEIVMEGKTLEVQS